MKLNKNHTQSIFRRILVPLMLIVVMQIALFAFAMSYTSVFDKIQSNATRFFCEKTESRKNYLQYEMLNRWSNLEEEGEGIASIISDTLQANGKTAEDMKTDAELNAKIIDSISLELISTLRRKATTGAFCILNGNGVKGNEQSYASMYIRDTDPSNQSKDNTDLLLLRGLPPLSRKLGIPLESFWEASSVFTDEVDERSQYFFNPLLSAEKSGDKNSKYYGYWSGSFTVGDESDLEVITYSIPIIGSDGTVYGVLGIDLTTDYISRLLTYDEIADEKRGVYILGTSIDNGQSYNTVCSSGPAYFTYFQSAEKVTVSDFEDRGISEISAMGKENGKLAACVNKLDLYNRNTPFVNQQWALISVMPKEVLFSFSTQLRDVLVFCGIFALAIGIAVTIFTSKNITQPISGLVNELKRSDPNKAIKLKRTDIQEIDELSGSIENLSNSVAEASSRISKIITMSHVPLGVFEYQISSKRAFCSESLFSVMDWKDWNESNPYYSRQEMFDLFDNIETRTYEQDSNVYRVSEDNDAKWVRISVQNEDDLILGVVVDVTNEIKQKQKIEYERDYDTLTNTLNRRAFHRIVEDIFCIHKEQLKVAAIIMFDLDNLKYLNDKYGHDCGDRYIQSFSEKIKLFEKYGAVVARRSGDEFYVLIFGFDSKDEIREIIKNIWDQIKISDIILPDSDLYKIRASGGISWYPDDSDNYSELIRYADFAMYSIKHSIKGNLAEFDIKSYNSDFILVGGSEPLNRLIELELVKYALQPVVDSNGCVYGYEMLMRPQMHEFSSPIEVLRIAKAQSKMQQIERLTWEVALKTYKGLEDEGKIDKNKHIFINSTSSHALTSVTREKIEQCYSGLLSRVVLEITEGEQQNTDFLSEKLDMMNSWGGQIAIDDFGTGYNSELSLLTSSPNIVKLDISLVSGVNDDEDRQRLISGIINYAKNRNITVLGEGVETYEEMKTLVSLGVELLQGYYIARPSFDVVPIRESLRAEIIDAKAARTAK
ncbi:MAG: EAL domain-containing protein [Oscillospiraceae bacterium]